MSGIFTSFSRPEKMNLNNLQLMVIPSMDNMVLLADMLDVTINDILVCNDVNV